MLNVLEWNPIGMPEDRRIFLESRLLAATYRFAHTMRHMPHHYTLRWTWDVDEEFMECAQLIRDYGFQEYFGKRVFVAYAFGGHKYWTMGSPIKPWDKTKTEAENREGNTILINRRALKPEDEFTKVPVVQGLE